MLAYLCYPTIVKIVVNSPKYGKQVVLIDNEDGHLVKGKGLYVHHAGQFLYVRVNPGKVSLHRLITKAPKNLVVDHINRNTLDNRRKNLRVVTIQENLRNQKRPNNKTGYTGVAVLKDRFTAQIKVNYKKIHLGVFKTVEEAYKARIEAEKKYYETKSPNLWTTRQ